MSSIPNGQKDEWSSASEELFRAARSDHAPTSADRERVRRALAERMAVGPSASSAGGLSGHAGGVLSRALKVCFGVSLVVVGTIAVKRVQEPARVVQPSAAVPSAAAAASGGSTQPETKVVAADNAAEALAADGRRSVSWRNDAPAAREAAVQVRDSAASARSGRRPHGRAASPQADSRVARAETGQAAFARADQPQRAQDADLGQRPAARAADDATAERSERARAQPPMGRTAADEPATHEQRAPQASTHEAQDDSQSEDARAELTFVRKMQAALRAGEAEEVLELSQEHAQRWPQGTFVQEREGLRAIASCNTAAQSAAARAKAFLTKYPRTPLGPRVREACKLQLEHPGTAAAVSGESQNAKPSTRP